MLSKILSPSSTFQLCISNVAFTFTKDSLFHSFFYFECRETLLSALRLPFISHFCYSAEAKFRSLNYINRIYIGSNFKVVRNIHKRGKFAVRTCCVGIGNCHGQRERDTMNPRATRGREKGRKKVDREATDRSGHTI